MTQITKNVKAQEIADKSVTVIEQLNDSCVYKQYFAVPHGLWMTISTYGGKNDMSVHGNSVSETDAMKQVNSAIEKAKTNPNISVVWGKFSPEAKRGYDGRLHGYLSEKLWEKTRIKLGKPHQPVRIWNADKAPDKNVPRFHGKRTHAPKKNLADTFDKNFKKML